MAGDEKKNIHKLFKEYSSDHDKTSGQDFRKPLLPEMNFVRIFVHNRINW